MSKTSEPYSRSELIANRYLEVVQNGELILGDRIKVIQSEFNKMNFKPMAEAAKQLGISYNGMKKRISEGREMFIRVGG